MFLFFEEAQGYLLGNAVGNRVVGVKPEAEQSKVSLILSEQRAYDHRAQRHGTQELLSFPSGRHAVAG